MGDLLTPWLREPVVIAALLPGALAAGSVGARALSEHRERLHVVTFGGFELRRAANPVRLPPGRASELVRMVVAAGGSIRTEAAIEALWPETAPDLGRNRLRNLLSRLRAEAGDVLCRDGALIALPPGHDIDAQRFDDYVRAALIGDDPTPARAAITLYRGDFLPDEPAELASLARDRRRADFVRMLDIAAKAADAQGETDEAIRLLERAVDTVPDDEIRHVRLVRLLTTHGRARAAVAAARRAATSLAEWGVPVPPELSGHLV